MTKITFHIVVLFISVITLASCSREDKVSLFNGEDLNNWTGILFDSITTSEEVFMFSNGKILITGEPHGYIITDESFHNYKLHLEWRWIEKPGNSGIFIHCQGIDDSHWPICIEVQLKHLNAGGFIIKGRGTSVNIGGTTFRVPNTGKSSTGIRMSEESSENTPGDWNVCDITCDNSNIEVAVNGIIQNFASESTLNSGKIALQSEGGSIEFRNLYIVKLQ